MSTAPQSVPSLGESQLNSFPFTRDWLNGQSLPLQYLPMPSEAIRRRAQQLLDDPWTPWTSEEIAEVREFNRGANNAAGADLADYLGDVHTRVVVTGQQPDLLAAPLFVLHKALSAIAWAKKLSEQTGARVVPVFWVASDDDDFSELKQASLVGYEGTVTDVGGRIARGTPGNAEAVAYEWNLQESAPRLKEDLGRVLSGWAGGREVADWLTERLGEQPNFEALFCRLLAELLGPNNPILFVAPRLTVFRGRQVGLLQADIEGHASLNAELSALNTEFEGAGYNVGLTREPEALNFFWLKDGIRHRLVRRNGKIIALENRKNTPAWESAPDELRARIAAAPAEFAPNVVTRPLLQDEVLPSLAYVGGPGEVAYLAILGRAYSAYGRGRAAVIPRTLVTMMPADRERARMIEDHLGANDVSSAVLQHGGDDAVALAAALADFTATISDRMTVLRGLPAAGRTEVARALDKTEAHLLHGLDQLKRRLAKQVATDEWQRVNRLRSIVLPDGGNQERKLAPWNFVQAGHWHELAKHLSSHVDYTRQGVAVAPLPPWLEEQL